MESAERVALLLKVHPTRVPLCRYSCRLTWCFSNTCSNHCHTTSKGCTQKIVVCHVLLGNTYLSLSLLLLPFLLLRMRKNALSSNIHSYYCRTEKVFGDDRTELPPFGTEGHRTRESKWFVQVIPLAKQGQKSRILNF